MLDESSGETLVWTYSCDNSSEQMTATEKYMGKLEGKIAVFKRRDMEKDVVESNITEKNSCGALRALLLCLWSQLIGWLA
jgi:hypothetical protein